MSKKYLVLLASLVFTGFVSAARAEIIINWNGPNDGDYPAILPANNTEITFTGFLANTLLEVTGDGYSRTGGIPGVVFGLELRLDGVWTNVYSWSNPDSLNHPLSSEIPASLSFATSTVSGIRLTDMPTVNFGFGGLRGTDGEVITGERTGFVFELVELEEAEPTVPEPSSLVLFCAGMIGLAAARRRPVTE